MVMRAGVLRARLHKFGVTVPAGGAITTAWNTGTAYDGNFTFTNSNRTVLRITSNSAGNMIAATKGMSATDKCYWEVTVVSHFATNDCGFGVCDGAGPIGVNGFSNFVGGQSAPAYSVGFLLNGNEEPGGLNLGAGFADGDTALLAYDGPNKELHVFCPARGSWDRAGVATPVAGNGLVIGSTPTTIFPVATCDEFGPPGDSLTLNTGVAAFVNNAAITAAQGAGYVQLG